MVCNIFKILDENEIKQLSMVDYNMNKIDLFALVLKKSDPVTIARTFCNEECDYISNVERNDEYKEPPPIIKYALKKTREQQDMYMTDFAIKNGYKWNTNESNKYMIRFAGDEKTIYDYLEIIPFTPSVMINISPDWSNIKRSNSNKVTILKTIIDNYMQEQWYDKWEYVIENGSDGTHIHAHIVAHMNVNRLKSVESHLKKGNHTQQLKKYAKKLKGMEGIIKGSSVQKVFLRTEEIVNDKLLYLHEDTKPEGHKNKSVIENGFVSGCL